jgi:hypothetical protein
VTSSLMKDMNSKTDMSHANAIRVLFHIIDSTLLTQIDLFVFSGIRGHGAIGMPCPHILYLRIISIICLCYIYNI